MRILICIFAVALMACSRSPETPAPATPAPPAAAVPVVAPAAPVESAALSPEQIARLVRPHSPVLGRSRRRRLPWSRFSIRLAKPARRSHPWSSNCCSPIPRMFGSWCVMRTFIRFPSRLCACWKPHACRAKPTNCSRHCSNDKQEWASHSAPNPARAWQIASDAGINVARARKDALATSVDDMLNIEADDLTALRIERTPTFFVNGKPLPTFGAQQLMDLVASEVQAAKSIK